MEHNDRLIALIQYFESKLGRELKEEEMNLLKEMLIWQQISSR
ncbi:hypothetical protein RYX56_06150 [Alkalihalophilus lindianensis]|uniref:Fur-regulated basic protein A n=1 Tax=Alkalihalophilus lindianensis TaxID=1630542 RepID=A0ABU3X7U3_9BACI|nr:hypothetical protein [Alkalihalophilus lindianensis]MDV2683956.1 hypothetical protein [Alkalihalophilus lindianensis]